MRPDVSREMQWGWSALAGAALIAVVTWWWLLGSVAAAASAVDERAKRLPGGPRELAATVEEQRNANDRLAETIVELKDDVGFSLDRDLQAEGAGFQPYLQQPGFFFQTRRDRIIDELQEIAQAKGISTYDRYLGFGIGLNRAPAAEPPPPDEALYLLHVLQLSAKAARLALQTPTPLEKLVVSHGRLRAPHQVGPAGRPPLWREYGITLEVKGSLRDILHILHGLSPGRDSDDYPLILRKLRITSVNVSADRPISQLDCVMELAGMEFVGDAPQTVQPTRPTRARALTTTRTPAATTTAPAPGRPIPARQ